MAGSDLLQSLPRTRGDRPSKEIPTWHENWSSPHTRGSTLLTLPQKVAAAVFPAHAGIDRRAMPSGYWRSGLPRTRGDRPYNSLRKGALDESSPHTRGSTSPEIGPHSPVIVFPAHAGIDLTCLPRRPLSRRLPRTRGDRPQREMLAQKLEKSSPHTRGSTFAPAQHSGNLRVFPAHAGIDPFTRASAVVICCLPRTRGDRPAQRPLK